MSHPAELLLRTPRFSVVRHTLASPGGAQVVKETIRHPGAVTILPLLDGDRVCLIRNRRVAVGRSLIELPAGTLEPGEEAIVTARRELAEETGYTCRSLRQLHAFYLSPGILDERMLLFVAEDLAAGKPSLEPDEQIETLVVPWEEALTMIDDGRIEDAKTIVGLLYYERLRRRE